MKKYKRKPVVVDVIEFTGKKDNLTEIKAIDEGIFDIGGYGRPYKLVIPTSSGQKCMNIGDYLIIEESKEISICRADMFSKTYDKI